MLNTGTAYGIFSLEEEKESWEISRSKFQKEIQSQKENEEKSAHELKSLQIAHRFDFYTVELKYNVFINTPAITYRSSMQKENELVRKRTALNDF